MKRETNQLGEDNWLNEGLAMLFGILLSGLAKEISPFEGDSSSCNQEVEDDLHSIDLF